MRGPTIKQSKPRLEQPDATLITGYEDLTNDFPPGRSIGTAPCQEQPRKGGKRRIDYQYKLCVGKITGDGIANYMKCY